MSNIVHLEMKDETVARIVKAAFSEYTGRKVQCHVTEDITFHSTNWESGYRRQYVMLNMATLQKVEVPKAPFMQSSAPHENGHKIPEGCAVVVNVDGRAPHVEIHTPSESITKALTQQPALTEDELIVLVATRSLKSSYGGIPNYRFHQAKERRGITLDRWNAAKQLLIDKKLLNSAGAITVAGRNVPMDNYL